MTVAWVKIDEHFYDHPKWADAPGDSIALWLAAMAWCNRNDSTTGFIPVSKVRGLVSVKRVRNTCRDLCEREAFHEVPGGYLIHDYEEYQQPEKVKEIASKRAAAGRKGAAHRWEAARAAKEHAAAPLPPEHQDPDQMSDMANPMAIAMANRCPDTVNRLPNENKSSSVLTVVPPHNSDDDDLSRTIALIVEAKEREHQPRNRKAWRAKVCQNTRLEDGELIRRMLDDGDQPETVALFVLGHGISVDDIANGPSPLVPWCDQDCPTCEGDSWIDQPDGLAPCPDRKATTP